MFLNSKVRQVSNQKFIQIIYDIYIENFFPIIHIYFRKFRVSRKFIIFRDVYKQHTSITENFLPI